MANGIDFEKEAAEIGELTDEGIYVKEIAEWLRQFAARVLRDAIQAVPRYERLGDKQYNLGHRQGVSDVLGELERRASALEEGKE